MKRRIFSCVTVALLALAARPGAAQEKPPGGEGVLPPPKPVPTLPPAPAPVTAPEPAPLVPPGCGVRVLWLEHQVPVERLVPREVITEERRPSMEVAYRDEKREVIETVVKSREVERLVPCTVMKPFTETCPETGQCTTVWKPCTEMRTVKEPEYYAVQQPRTVVVPVPYLKPAEIVVPHKTIVLEYLTTTMKHHEAVVIPGPECQPTPYVMPPQPCHDEHP
jgi:hypothetical protein